MNKKLQQFKEGKLVLHTPTQEIYNKLMQWCDERGIRWGYGITATEHNHWNDYKNKTCINNSMEALMYRDWDYYREKGRTIAMLTDDDFKEDIMFTKDDLKTGMVVEIRNGRRYMVLQDVKIMFSDYQGILLMRSNDAINGKNINNDLTTSRNSKWDIMKIYRPLVGTLENTIECCDESNLIWQRESTEKQALRKNIEKLEQELAEAKKNLEAIV